MFLKKPFISILLVGSIMAILTAGCGRSGQAAGADMSAATTTAATTKTTGTTATNRTTDPSSAAATTTDTVEADEQTVERPTGWSEASHSNDSDPNYDLVFPQDKVNQITITIDPEELGRDAGKYGDVVWRGRHWRRAGWGRHPRRPRKRSATSGWRHAVARGPAAGGRSGDRTGDAALGRGSKAALR